MKKLTVLVSALALVLGCTACGNPNSASSGAGVNESTATPATISTASLKGKVFSTSYGGMQGWIYINDSSTAYFVTRRENNYLANSQAISFVECNGSRFAKGSMRYSRTSGSGLYTTWSVSGNGQTSSMSLSSNGSISSSGVSGTFTNNNGIITAIVSGNTSYLIYDGTNLEAVMPISEETNSTTKSAVIAACNSAS